MFNKNNTLILMALIAAIFFNCLQTELYAGNIYLIDESSSDSGSTLAEDGLPDFLAADGEYSAGDTIRDYEVQRYREIELSRELTEAGKLIYGDKVILNLFDDVQYKGSLDRTNVNINGTYSLRVRLDDYQFGYMLISTTRERTLAKIRIPENNEFYLIKSDPETYQHYLLDIGDENRHHLESAPPLLPEDDDLRERRRDDKEDARYENQDSNTPKRNPGPYDHAIIDIMIVYTPLGVEWAEQAGGGIDNVVAQTMEISQLAIDNSNAILTFNLAHAGVVDYIESGDSIQDLMRIRNGWDDYMPEVHDWRDEYGADLVGFIAVMDDHGGAAWLLNTIGGRPESGFSITRMQQAAHTYTFAHEIGHNMGLHHHPDQLFSPGPGIFDYSAGWRWTGEDNNRYCSIMSYESGQYFEDGLDFTRVGYFSNPDINYQGVATGHPQRADNARTLRETKHVVAGYRERTYVVEEYPYAESFEGNFPPHQWTKGTIAGETRWQRSAGGHDNNPPGAADGNFNALFYAGGERGNSGYIVTPEFDFRGRVNRRLNFSHAQAARDDNQDILNVYYRQSRIDEWTRIASYTENRPDWTEISIDLPYTVDRMFIKFEAVTDNGYGVAIDNVRVNSEPAADFPVTASNPHPAHESISVPVDLEALRWSYQTEEDHEDPAGFRVYFGMTDEFGADDDFVWVPYEDEREHYSTSEILPELQIGRRYYWQVVPTTRNDVRRSFPRPGRSEHTSGQRQQRDRETGSGNYDIYRNDAVDCPVWSFWTEGPLVDVAGRVIGNDAPDGLVDAVVFFSNAIDTFRVETGNNGEFAINNVEGSADGLPYTLRITNEGYQPHTSEHQVMAEALNMGNIRLDELARKPLNLAAAINETRDAVHLNWEAPDPGRTASNPRQRRKTDKRSRNYEKTRLLEGYNLYRFDINDEDNYEQWEFLTFTENREYIDIQWPNLDIAGYRYAVKAVYTDNVFSEFIHSDIISNEFSGGYGTEQSPWLISSASELNRVRNYSGEKRRDKYFLQIADIDFAGTEWSEGEGWLPIGKNGSRFKGHYNGNRHTIANLMINREDENFIGLFGYCKEATLENITIKDADVTGDRWTGILVGDITGKSDNRAKIISCSASGEVTGSSRVGGLAGLALRSKVETSSAEANVTATGDGEVAAGGLVGFLGTESTACNCYATSRVTVINDGFFAAALTGRISRATVTNCYAVGTVNAQRSAGGLVGREYHSPTYNSYWNLQTTQQEESAGGEGRTTAQMTYPYDDETYIDWDFEDIWMEDVDYELNFGYPFLRAFYSESPKIAENPSPADDSSNVSVLWEELSWSYFPEPTFTDPLGFRVYFNKTGEFTEDDDFVWVPYEDEQTNYANSDILPEKLDYYSEYFWKVVPTTEQPARNHGNKNRKQRINPGRVFTSYRNDAEGTPVWSFRTEKNPQPVTAINPYPADESVDVAVALDSLQWSYEVDPRHVNPAGFEVYLNTTGDFTEDDEYDWIDFCSETKDYASSELLTEELDYETTYYWQVIPAIAEPDRRINNDKITGNSEDTDHRQSRLTADRRRQANRRCSSSPLSVSLSLDDENGLKPEVWSFTTEKDTYVETVPELVTRLDKNYPNPFNPETVIGFSIAEPGNVTVEIYNLKGQKVKILVDSYLSKGHHQAVWNGLGEDNKTAGSGLYIYRMKTGNYTEAKKMILLR